MQSKSHSIKSIAKSSAQNNGIHSLLDIPTIVCLGFFTRVLRFEDSDFNEKKDYKEDSLKLVFAFVVETNVQTKEMNCKEKETQNHYENTLDKNTLLFCM